MKDFLSRENGSGNFILGDIENPFPRKQKATRIGIQYEHTLVLPGGRHSDGFPSGKVPAASGGTYLVRLDNIERLRGYDFIVDYSLPNLFNIRESGCFKELESKLLYIPPLIDSYCASPVPTRRNVPLLTNFTEPLSDRRTALFEELKKIDVPVLNVTGCFGAELSRRLRDTRVMINFHQTDHHHTFEELRVVPALLNGVVVISEDVPCRQMIPYHEHILWADKKDVAKLASEVSRDYESFYLKIFGAASTLPEIMASLHVTIERELRKLTTYTASTYG